MEEHREGLQAALFFETPEEIYARVFRTIRPRTPLPRIRIDQVMHACMKYLLPFTMLLFIGSSGWQLLGDRFAGPVRYGLGALGLAMVGLYLMWAFYGYFNRWRLVGRLARKHLPGA